MAEPVKVPRLGQEMTGGTLIRWLKADGERVRRGEPLYELDTDKVTQEVEADASGVLLRIAVQEGEVEVGHTIAVIGDQGEEVPEAAADEDGEDGAPQSAEKPAQAPAREEERERGRAARGRCAGGDPANGRTEWPLRSSFRGSGREWSRGRSSGG